MATGTPDLAAVKVYLQRDVDDTSQDAEIADALDAELAAQGGVCRIPADPADLPADMREAVLRRVARNLALRGHPIMVLRGDAEAGVSPLVLPGRDPEVRRLEAPHRKLVMG